ncbi:DUF429 domain-containing protein [Marivirga harenae]|uniref:DUF429 domain-containing protein n=1 Tax=Marivirga harenae TaxID=2010992 RepID=UPI0026E09D86|nr:DUF429 domain-containing protein [Marivirga harenae]WKV10865.1 DUF429 domain-containing protein [Marivirga harenae]
MKKELKNKEISIGWDVGGWSGKNHGLCILEIIDDEIKLLMATNVNIYHLKEKIETTIHDYQDSHSITLGIDAPLQFPQLFKEIINHNPINIFSSIKSKHMENPIAWRATDLYIKNYFGKTPLSASFSFLTSNATVAISLIGELRSKFENFSVLPFDEHNHINAVEVYPGLLKSINLRKHSIFHDFKKILDRKIFQGIKGFDYYFRDSKEKTDVADAVICAIFVLGLNRKIKSIPGIKSEIPQRFIEISQEEGWIYHPDLA